MKKLLFALPYVIAISSPTPICTKWTQKDANTATCSEQKQQPAIEYLNNTPFTCQPTSTFNCQWLSDLTRALNDSARKR